MIDWLFMHVQALPSLNNKFGAISVKFGEALSVKEFVAKNSGLLHTGPCLRFVVST